MNKLLVVLFALVALAVLLPHLLEPSAAPAVTPTPHTPDRALVQVAEDGGRAATATGGGGAEVDQPREREAAVAPPASLAADAPVRGRVLYQSTGQGVPYAPVSLRTQQKVTLVRTNRDGSFAAPDVWPADAEIAVIGAPTMKGSEPERDDPATSGLAKPELATVQGLPLLVDPDRKGTATSAGKVPATQTHFQPLASAAVREGDGWCMVVELGPTYLLKVADDARVQGLQLRAFLRDDDDALATRVQRSAASTSACETAPDDRLQWCRVPAPPSHYGDRCRLVVLAEGGFWRAEIADVGTKGVVGPLDVTLHEQGHVRGTVRDAFGAPMDAVQVVVTIGDGPRALRFATRTDPQGDYTLTGVQPGEGHAKVAGEEFEPNAAAVQVQAGAVARCDLVVRRRAKGGRIAGTITTTSGKSFPMVSVHLTSHQDGTIWRTANIEWQEVDGKQQATFGFADVPLLECAVQLNPFAPCRLQARRQTVTPPQEHVHFRIDDVVQERDLSIDVRQRDGTPCPSWTLRLVGDDGWQVDVRAQDSGSPVRIPQLPGTWRLLGPAVRGHTGRLEAIPGDRLVIQAEPGWSMQLVVMDIANYFPVRGAPVFADGQQVGVLDDEGELLLDLPAAP
ncbi:MAG: carboxypeptidase regulatory-like domain-containing protein, partial [Planctomycetes bacterium]|nr:carboxypeptidase regulatory-like domain-containing protein [Planctomycetota bacterium]